MKFLIYILLISFFVSKSQNNTFSVFTIKPTLGLNICQIHGDSYSGYDKIGVLGGFALNARFKNKISFELGFYFSQKGARHNPDTENGDYSYYNVNLNYIDLPLSFVYQLNSNYFLSSGFSFAYLVNYNEEIDYVNKTGEYKFNNSELGINFGLGRKINSKFYVEVRSSNSITPIRDYGIIANKVFYPNLVASFFNKGLYNNILSLIVSYQIDLNHGK